MAMTEVLKHTNWTLRTKLSVRSKDGEITRVIAFVYWLLLLSNYLIKNNKKMTIIMTLFIAMIVIIILISTTFLCYYTFNAGRPIWALWLLSLLIPNQSPFFVTWEILDVAIEDGRRLWRLTAEMCIFYSPNYFTHVINKWAAENITEMITN